MPLLFSYGTLRQRDVQLSIFGRPLEGRPDELIGFRQTVFMVTDPEFVATSGQAEHAMVVFDGRSNSRVAGIAFELSDEELTMADRYEPAGYARVQAPLASGRTAWVYTAAQP